MDHVQKPVLALSFNNIVKTFALSTFRPNCLGVMGEKEGWRLCMDINLTGVLHGTNLAME